MKTAKIIRDNHGDLHEEATGVGEVSEAQIRSRAAELAVTDGRKAGEFTEADYLQAREELCGASIPRPEESSVELIEGVHSLVEAVPSAGHRVAKVRFEEVETIGSILVKEGIEEAQHDEMLEAGKETLQDEEMEK